MSEEKKVYQISIQPDEEMRRQIAALAKRWGMARQRHNTGVIQRCLDRVFAIEFGEQSVSRLAGRPDPATDRTRKILVDLRDCITSIGMDTPCQCTNPPEDHEPAEDPDDWHSHAQYCPVYLDGYITSLLDEIGGEK